MNQKKIVFAAVSTNGVIGEGSNLPWNISEDLKHFKEQTTGYPVIMGRYTWESLPLKYRPLPNRRNIVISATLGYVAEGAEVFTSIDEALKVLDEEKVFFIGGVRIWYEVMPFVDEAYITIVQKDFPITDGITHLAPKLINPPSNWEGFHFNEMVMGRDEDVVPVAFKIVHWVRKK
jgi:dihydrofolate reductase